MHDSVLGGAHCIAPTPVTNSAMGSNTENVTKSDVAVQASKPSVVSE